MRAEPRGVDRILVIRRGGLGDTLLTAPLLRALRRQFQGASVHLAGTREYCDVLCAYGIIDVAHSAEEFWLWLPERARQSLSSFGLVIGDEPGLVHHAFDLQGLTAPRPSALQLARQVGFEPEWPSDCQLRQPTTKVSGPILIAPGSGGVSKCWPREHWLALVSRETLRSRPLRIVVGPVEQERDDPRNWPWPVEVSFLVDQSPVQLAKSLEQAGLFIGNDSGTTHLAAMLGVPTLAIFLDSDPAVWAPVGSHVTVAGDGLCLPSVDAVWSLLKRCR
jgi:heptosyltransferase III